MDDHVQVVKLLLDHGVDINMPPDTYDNPITLNTYSGNIELTSLLIE
jgi:ankyrin repeat protein